MCPLRALVGFLIYVLFGCRSCLYVFTLFGVVKVVFLLAVVLVADLGRPAVILARVIFVLVLFYMAGLRHDRVCSPGICYKLRSELDIDVFPCIGHGFSGVCPDAREMFPIPAHSSPGNMDNFC